MLAKTLVLLAAVAAVGFACQCRKTTQKEQFDAADVVARVVVTNRRFARDHVIYDIRYVEVFKPNQQVPADLNANSTSSGQQGGQQQQQNGTSSNGGGGGGGSSGQQQQGGNSQQNSGQQQQNGTSSSQQQQQQGGQENGGQQHGGNSTSSRHQRRHRRQASNLPAQISTPISAAACGAVGLVPAGPRPSRRSIEYLIAGKRENDSIAISACSGIPPRDNQFGTPLGALRWNLVNSELQQKLRSGKF
ncbi:hypothetical protein M3Y99_01331600 [Aphelenchoides fujianensis]|nr:hypothetical protein M3Y99_01331600 [Aphelenchoides fujianensis]